MYQVAMLSLPIGDQLAHLTSSMTIIVSTFFTLFAICVLILTAPWPRITLSINPHSHDRPLVTTHVPPLDNDISLQPEKLSVQDLLVHCIRVRSITILKELRQVFIGSPWEHQSTLIIVKYLVLIIL